MMIATMLVMVLALACTARASGAAEDGEPAPAFGASDLIPLSPRRALFLLRTSDGSTREVTWSRLPVPEDGERWRIEVPGVQAELIERGEDGRVHVLTHWDYQKGHRIEYEPPALLLPARLEPGAESRSESHVVVYDVEDGSKTASGTCVHRVRLVGETTLDAPAGDLTAVRVDIDRTVDIFIADARVTIELAFVPGRGRVMERVVERVSFFGLGGGRDRRTLELVAEEIPSHAD